MKALSTLTFLICSCFYLNAQTINQLWGLTNSGGTDHAGSLFTTSTSGNNIQLRHEFMYSTPGALPQFTQMVEYNGKLYGVTGDGGTNDFGIIFEWDPVTDVYKSRHNFTTATGRYPYGGLTVYNNKLYGMTQYGGVNSLGVIFEFDPATNIFTKKIDFDGTIGSNPYGGFTESGGKLYGMTNQGGVNNAGVIFEWDPVTNVYSKKIDLSNTLGRNPYGNLFLSGGLFYGMTSSGGANFNGVIFQWNPATNVYTKKIDLITANGSQPLGSFTAYNGKLYASTQYGGANFAGVIFEWDPATNIYTKKIDLLSSTGSGPTGNLIYSGSSFYGMTSSGGSSGSGAIFEWNPVTNVYTEKIDLSSVLGISPYGSLTLYGSKFYGLTYQGGITISGTLFEWDPTTNIFTVKRNFRHAVAGQSPGGSITSYNGKIYGTTSLGGANDKGAIFEWDISTKAYSIKYDFATSSGANPLGRLALYNGKFYGATTFGGTFDQGVLFEWDPATNIYTNKINLSFALGEHPTGELCLNAGKFYGMTRDGPGSTGGIFEWDPVTNVYTSKVNFNITNGSYPATGLTYYNSKFYGTTVFGGSNSRGVIFEWDPLTNIITKKIDMSNTIGAEPRCSLVMFNNKFYGTTKYGGAGSGVIFEWDPLTNVYTKKYDFSSTEGWGPIGSLMLSNGKLYGMTQYGGTGNGVIFEWDPATDVYTKKIEFNGVNGAFPQFNDLVLAPAPVSKGSLNNCSTVPSITIDNTNNNIWVPVFDNLGDIVAEINANGNNLGIVTTSLYTKNGNCREDATNRLYLNRNITITPQNQPIAGNVSLRLYILKTELDSLRTAMNSLNQPSGVASINEVNVFKNNDACASMGTAPATALTSTSGSYYSDYFLQISVNSFSSFYFANKLLSQILPVKLKSFSGTQSATNNLLNWEVSCNTSLNFIIERSAEGVYFEALGRINANIDDCGKAFHFYDYNPNVSQNYYRLKIIEPSGTVTYSPIILLKGDNSEKLELKVERSIVTGSSINLQILAKGEEQVDIFVSDITGRIIYKQKASVHGGNNVIPLNGLFSSAGIYYLYGLSKSGKTNIVKVIKQ